MGKDNLGPNGKSHLQKSNQATGDTEPLQGLLAQNSNTPRVH